MQKPKRPLYYKRILIVSFLFAAVGGVMLLDSHAATQPVAKEPENGTLSNGAVKVGDTLASNSSAVQFGGSSYPLYFGDLMTQTSTAPSESALGVKVAMLELNWSSYEPISGQFNASYINNMKSNLAAYKAAGMRVTLATGVHYTPSWVLGLLNSHYIDEHGTNARQANVVFNQIIRNVVAAYYAEINKDFDMSNFWAIRVTSGGNAEMLYPGNSYYAFDVNAQNGPDMPPSMSRNPFPGWKPGTKVWNGSAITVAQVGQWADWYIGALDNVTNWQMTTFTNLGFKGYFQTLTPGSGVRPDAYAKAASNYLPDGLTGVGAAWATYYGGLSNKKQVVTYISSVADNSGSNDSCQPNDNEVAITNPITDQWSATRYQARLASAYNLQVGGENPGYGLPVSDELFYKDTSSRGMMATAIRQAESCHFQTFYWAHDFRLYDGTQLLSNYAAFIKAIHPVYN